MAEYKSIENNVVTAQNNVTAAPKNTEVVKKHIPIAVKIIGIILLLITASFSSYYLGTQSKNGELNDCIAESVRYKDAMDFIYPEITGEIYSISGTIKSINDNLITLEISSLKERTLPGEEPRIEVITITLNDDTEIMIINLFNTINEGFDSALEGKAVSVSELEVGNIIIVDTVENIINGGELTVEKITYFVTSTGTEVELTPEELETIPEELEAILEELGINLLAA